MFQCKVPAMSGDPSLQLLDASPFGVIAVASDLQVRGWNRSAAGTFAIAADVAIGRGLAELLTHPHGESGWRELLAADGAAPQVVTLGAVTCEFQHQPHHGGHLLFVRDITARHARTVISRRQEHLLRALVDNLDVVVWAVDPDGVFNYHEGKALQTAGLRPGQFIGLNAYELYGDSAGNAAIRAALRGQSGRDENHHHGVHWEHWFAPIRDDDGAVVGCAGVAMDVTAARVREQELQQKLDVIEQQQRLIRGLTTPIIEVWDSVLTVPMIGLVDPARATELMEDLLQAVTRTRARFAVLDLTALDSLDTASAAGLVNLVHALRLLGAEGIVTGIHPQVAQTLVALGVDLTAIPVHADLRSALRYCIARLAARPGPAAAR